MKRRVERCENDAEALQRLNFTSRPKSTVVTMRFTNYARKQEKLIMKHKNATLFF